MGFPLRSNLFKTGSKSQQYFSRFPVQVAVLFRPGDTIFREAFSELFAHLDSLTGDAVAFFAVLDPPKEWEQSARRARWRDQQDVPQEVGFTYDDRPLVRELSRLFGIHWDALPALVASSNLWSGAFVTARTSVWLLEQQLQALTRLVHEWGPPELVEIADMLADVTSGRLVYQPGNDAIRRRLYLTYETLNTFGNDDLAGAAFGDLLRDALLESERRIRLLRQNSQRNELAVAEVLSSADDAAADAVLEDVAGRLVVPATVAERALGRLTDEHRCRLVDSLDEESATMIEEALRIGDMLERELILQSHLFGMALGLRSSDQTQAGNTERD